MRTTDLRQVTDKPCHLQCEFKPRRELTIRVMGYSDFHGHILPKHTEDGLVVVDHHGPTEQRQQETRDDK